MVVPPIWAEDGVLRRRREDKADVSLVPADRKWKKTYGYYENQLSENKSIQEIIDENFSELQAALIIPADTPDLQQLQAAQSREYRAILETDDFEQVESNMALKLTMLEFGLPVEPLRLPFDNLREYMDDREPEASRYDVKPPLHFLTAHKHRNWGKDSLRGRESLVYPLPISDRIETDDEIDSEEDGNGGRLMVPISAGTFESNHEGAQLCLRGGGDEISDDESLYSRASSQSDESEEEREVSYIDPGASFIGDENSSFIIIEEMSQISIGNNDAKATRSTKYRQPDAVSEAEESSDDQSDKVEEVEVLPTHSNIRRNTSLGEPVDRRPIQITVTAPEESEDISPTKIRDFAYEPRVPIKVEILPSSESQSHGPIQVEVLPSSERKSSVPIEFEIVAPVESDGPVPIKISTPQEVSNRRPVNAPQAEQRKPDKEAPITIVVSSGDSSSSPEIVDQKSVPIVIGDSSSDSEDESDEEVANEDDVSVDEQEEVPQDQEMKSGGEEEESKEESEDESDDEESDEDEYSSSDDLTLPPSEYSSSDEEESSSNEEEEEDSVVTVQPRNDQTSTKTQSSAVPPVAEPSQQSLVIPPTKSLAQVSQPEGIFTDHKDYSSHSGDTIQLYGFQGMYPFQLEDPLTFVDAVRRLLGAPADSIRFRLRHFEADGGGKTIEDEIPENLSSVNSLRSLEYIKWYLRHDDKTYGAFFVHGTHEKTPEHFRPTIEHLTSEDFGLSRIVRKWRSGSRTCEGCELCPWAYIATPHPQCTKGIFGISRWGANHYSPYIQTALEVLKGQPEDGNLNHCLSKLVPSWLGKPDGEASRDTLYTYGLMTLPPNDLWIFEDKPKSIRTITMEDFALDDDLVSFFLPNHWPSNGEEWPLVVQSSQDLPEGAQKNRLVPYFPTAPDMIREHAKKYLSARSWENVGRFLIIDGNKIYGGTPSLYHSMLRLSKVKGDSSEDVDDDNHIVSFLAHSVGVLDSRFFIVYPEWKRSQCQIHPGWLPLRDSPGKERGAPKKRLIKTVEFPPLTSNYRAFHPLGHFRRRIRELYVANGKAPPSTKQVIKIWPRFDGDNAREKNSTNMPQFWLRPETTEVEWCQMRARIPTPHVVVEALPLDYHSWTGNIEPDNVAPELAWGPRYGRMAEPWRLRLAYAPVLALRKKEAEEKARRAAEAMSPLEPGRTAWPRRRSGASLLKTATVKAQKAVTVNIQRKQAAAASSRYNVPRNVLPSADITGKLQQFALKYGTGPILRPLIQARDQLLPPLPIARGLQPGQRIPQPETRPGAASEGGAQGGSSGGRQSTPPTIRAPQPLRRLQTDNILRMPPQATQPIQTSRAPHAPQTAHDPPQAPRPTQAPQIKANNTVSAAPAPQPAASIIQPQHVVRGSTQPLQVQQTNPRANVDDVQERSDSQDQSLIQGSGPGTAAQQPAAAVVSRATGNPQQASVQSRIERDVSDLPQVAGRDRLTGETIMQSIERDPPNNVLHARPTLPLSFGRSFIGSPREQAYTTQPRIHDRPPGQPPRLALEAPTRERPLISGDRAPSFVRNTLTLTEQEELQDELWRLRNQLLKRELECPFRGCAFRCPGDEQETLENHILDNHRKCLYCDDASFTHATLGNKMKHVVNEHRRLLLEHLTRDGMGAHAIIDGNESWTFTLARNDQPSSTVRPSTSNPVLSSILRSSAQQSLSAGHVSTAPVPARRHPGPSLRNQHYCDRCGRWKPPIGIPMTDITVIEWQIHNQRCQRHIYNGAKCTFCTLCGGFKWESSEDAIRSGADPSKQCECSSDKEGNAYCELCGMPYEYLLKDQILQHERVCRGFGATAEAFCYFCAEELNTGESEADQDERRAHFLNCPGNKPWDAEEQPSPSKQRNEELQDRSQVSHGGSVQRSLFPTSSVTTRGLRELPIAIISSDESSDSSDDDQEPDSPGRQSTRSTASENKERNEAAIQAQLRAEEQRAEERKCQSQKLDRQMEEERRAQEAYRNKLDAQAAAREAKKKAKEVKEAKEKAKEAAKESKERAANKTTTGKRRAEPDDQVQAQQSPPKKQKTTRRAGQRDASFRPTANESDDEDIPVPQDGEDIMQELADAPPSSGKKRKRPDDPSYKQPAAADESTTTDDEDDIPAWLPPKRVVVQKQKEEEWPVLGKRRRIDVAPQRRVARKTVAREQPAKKPAPAKKTAPVKKPATRKPAAKKATPAQKTAAKKQPPKPAAEPEATPSRQTTPSASQGSPGSATSRRSQHPLSPSFSRPRPADMRTRSTTYGLRRRERVDYAALGGKKASKQG
ncbi:hypothetical protein S40293_06267 [Stachybotrys chartarum IBT 40293]|nr:hypothetical protein S40293_06267 [Stachybotrys chartarum IBT 40293]